jgi:hypothetical protein
MEEPARACDFRIVQVPVTLAGRVAEYAAPLLARDGALPFETPRRNHVAPFIAAVSSVLATLMALVRVYSESNAIGIFQDFP